MVKHIFQSVVQGLPGRVDTSRFYGVSVPGYTYSEYDWLDMTLQENATYDVRGFYGIRDATLDNTVATGLSLKDGLKLLRDFQDTKIGAAKFDAPGAKPQDMFDTVLTRDDFMKKRSRKHIDFIGPRHGVRPRQALDAARLAQLRIARVRVGGAPQAAKQQKGLSC